MHSTVFTSIFGLVLGVQARAIATQPRYNSVSKRRDNFVPPVYGLQQSGFHRLSKRDVMADSDIQNAVNFYWGADGKLLILL
jgi:hypothetical protein